GVVDVLHTAPTREIVGRFIESLQEWSDSSRVGQAFRELITDVRRVEVGKHQHVRFTGDQRPRLFVSRHLWDDGGVELYVAVYGQIGPAFPQLCSGLPDLVDATMLGTTRSRERQQGDSWLHAQQAGCAIGR